MNSFKSGLQCYPGQGTQAPQIKVHIFLDVGIYRGLNPSLIWPQALPIKHPHIIPLIWLENIGGGV